MAIALYNITYIVSGSEDWTIRLWNLEKRRQETIFVGHFASVNQLCVLKNGEIVSGSSDYTVRIWNIDKNYENTIIYTSSCEISNIIAINENYIYIELQNTSAVMCKINEKIISHFIRNNNNMKFAGFLSKNGIYLNTGLVIGYISFYFKESEIKMDPFDDESEIKIYFIFDSSGIEIDLIFEPKLENLLNKCQELKNIIFPIQIAI